MATVRVDRKKSRKHLFAWKKESIYTLFTFWTDKTDYSCFQTSHERCFVFQQIIIR